MEEDRRCSNSGCKAILPPKDVYKYKTCEKHRLQARETKKRRSSGVNASPPASLIFPEIEERVCSNSGCKDILPPQNIYNYKTCQKHRQQAREAMKRKRSSGVDPSPRDSIRPPPHSPLRSCPNQSSQSTPSGSTVGGKEDVLPDSDDISEAESGNGNKRIKLPPPIRYENAAAMFYSLKLRTREKAPLQFSGSYEMTKDPLVKDAEQIRMVQEEIWKVTEYRFTVKDHHTTKSCPRSRFWCCQDQDHKKKSKMKTGSRDNDGMDRFLCKSSLRISVSRADEALMCQVMKIHLEHQMEHIQYYNVSLPQSAQELIRQNVWAFPSIIALNEVKCRTATRRRASWKTHGKLLRKGV
ncbi:hypothetical protein M422DRAFT_265380 [Sphaerobolus stellatus SS14]|uniref:Uncharacterized protein n=1 Tax=Sphaerobolus stellatus (strain SS14) TaxID=990650 RepID=A0A0C9UU16_SPHS4|nr:hypothetical protein M422DRAFT_265380 [Sphaerobolus stellatus SS14]